MTWQRRKILTDTDRLGKVVGDSLDAPGSSKGSKPARELGEERVLSLSGREGETRGSNFVFSMVRFLVMRPP